MNLGEMVRAARLARGWGLKDLSERSGVDVGTISALEQRNSERSRFAPQLARALGIRLDELLGGQAFAELAPDQQSFSHEKHVTAKSPQWIKADQDLSDPAQTMLPPRAATVP